ncbi:MAG TPA: hypothetical protein VGD67_25985 [Pseudonocardiaceae bacterium]
MSSDRLPSRLPTQRPVPARRDGVVAASSSGDLAARLTHRAGELAFAARFVSREDAWLLLPEHVRSRVDGRIGDLVEWWADVTGGRPRAVVLGTRAFVTVTPTVNAEGGAAQAIRALPLLDGTFRTAAVAERTTGRPAAGPVAPGRWSAWC